MKGGNSHDSVMAHKPKVENGGDYVCEEWKLTNDISARRIAPGIVRGEHE